MVACTWNYWILSTASGLGGDTRTWQRCQLLLELGRGVVFVFDERLLRLCNDSGAQLICFLIQYIPGHISPSALPQPPCIIRHFWHTLTSVLTRLAGKLSPSSDLSCLVAARRCLVGMTFRVQVARRLSVIVSECSPATLLFSAIRTRTTDTARGLARSLVIGPVRGTGRWKSDGMYERQRKRLDTVPCTTV